MHFYKIALVFVVIAGVVSLSIAENIDRAIIHSSGTIIPKITAKSGYWRDIQDAINIAASHGISEVYIPEGTWNFVNPGESWTGARVVIPAGVSLFGAPTERYENGSVKEWKTVLVMPWEMPGDKSYIPPHWFLVQGNLDPNKPSRFSDIKMVGYREFNHSASANYLAIRVVGVMNFRIDHCCFKEFLEGVQIGTGYGALRACGVIDHCIFDNEYVYYNLDWSTRFVGYAITCYRQESTTEWTNMTNILGKYLDYTVFIEDCVFTKWRSVATAEHGGHFVFRHNIVRNGLAHGEMDIHPNWNPPGVSGRAAEIYDNIFTDIDPEGNPGPHFVWLLYSGGGVFFNNTVSSYSLIILDSNCGWNNSFYPRDVYIWNNNLGNATLEDGPMEENVHYFLYKPDWYTPYPYPHPLTST